MIKLTRNTLHDEKELRDANGGEIKWEHLVQLHDLQTENGLHLGNRIRKNHISYAGTKMKVK